MEEPRQRSRKLEFVTLQFMMGGNVHLVGELQSQHTVEEFQQEVFARFPIPAFRVTSTVACNQATSRRAERGLSLHELGCSGQQDRIYSQLIFFLCSASSLTHWVGLDRLLEMLQQLKRCIDYIPVALVGVIVQADPELDLEQEVKALRWLKCLLDGVFYGDLLPGHDGTEQEVQVQVAVYQSGWPQRALEVKRAACQAIRAALNLRGLKPTSSGGGVVLIMTDSPECAKILQEDLQSIHESLAGALPHPLPPPHPHTPVP
uniref:Uncharacterized protein n=1 Tax=Chrysemys picta bellii TaxID=8478 RepID=A0A8C3IU76_CHRPI